MKATNAPSERDGSSPRVRGTLMWRLHALLKSRFIPACAGNAQVRDLEQIADRGSSPRVRGTRDGARDRERNARFIPACAGNARAPPRSVRCSPVHPRVCGERQTRSARARRMSGSSPRVRGTRSCAGSTLACARFIPACAGNAPARTPRYRLDTVHPRVCGERLAFLTDFHAASGSSPRVRGTPELRAVDGLIQRFIPACAGNAQPSRETPY